MKRKKLLWQLVPTYLTITFLALAGVVWVGIVSFKQFAMEKAERDLETRSKIIRHQVISTINNSGPAQVDSLIKSLRPISDAKITLADSTGKIIGDSHHSPEMMGNQTERPEFSVALQGSTVVGVRYDPELSQNLLYLTLPVFLDNRGAQYVLTLAIPQTRIHDVLYRTILVFIISGIIITVIAFIVTYFSSKLISRPIDELNDATRQFAKGNLDHRLPINDIEEFYSLNLNLNQMASQLQERLSTVFKQYREIEAVLTSMSEGVIAVSHSTRILKINQSALKFFNLADRENYTGKMLAEVIRNPDLNKFVAKVTETGENLESEIKIDKNQVNLQVHANVLHDEDQAPKGILIVLNDITKLRRLENMRKDFAANVSHELRTPLTNVKGFIETLMDGGIEEKETAMKFLNIVHKNIDRLNDIISDLLQLAKLEKDAETGEVTIINTSIEEVIKKAVQNCMVSVQTNNMEINIIAPQFVKTPVNPPLIELALTNLLENAIRHSPPGESVDIIVDRKNGNLNLSVRDYGQGIPNEHLGRIFERFYRVDPDRNRKSGGTGLGLALVKHIASVHQGKVSVKSKINKGSTFTIELPMNQKSVVNEII